MSHVESTYSQPKYLDLQHMQLGKKGWHLSRDPDYLQATSCNTGKRRLYVPRHLPGELCLPASLQATVSSWWKTLLKPVPQHNKFVFYRFLIAMTGPAKWNNMPWDPQWRSWQFYIYNIAFPNLCSCMGRYITSGWDSFCPIHLFSGCTCHLSNDSSKCHSTVL